jgi:hypothetical protein
MVFRQSATSSLGVVLFNLDRHATVRPALRAFTNEVNQQSVPDVS